MSDTNKPVALVTGGSRGIGFGICQALADEGFNIVFNGRRGLDDVTDVVTDLEQRGAKVLYCQADISDAASRAKMIGDIKSEFGQLNVLINNAGVAPNVRADILDAEEDSFDRLININLKGPYFLTQSVANWMIEQREADANFHGCVINVGSISATVASVNRGDYCISKAGIAMATQLWAVRLAEHEIDVFEIRPGIIATDMTSGVKEKYDKLIADGLTLQPRWGTPEDIGSACTVLASGKISYGTGQVLTLDGGLTASRL